MSTTTETNVTGLPGFSQFTRGCESLMKGMMSVVLKQMELGGDLLEGSMQDFSLLTQAQSPDKFIQAELEVFRRQSERAISAARKLSEEVNRSWSEASETLKTVN